MAFYKIFPSQDSSIYSEYPDTNTGLDQILECSTYIKDTSAQVSRYLIQFSNNDINNTINNIISGSQFNVYLKNYAAKVTGLNLTSKLYFHPISGSWGMGTGQLNDSPSTTNGVSWNWIDYSGSNKWATSSFGPYSTASYSSQFPGGGVWYTGSNLGLNIVHTQSFAYKEPVDIQVDVTNTVLTWYSGSIPNNGFIIKQQTPDEFSLNENNVHIFKYFSADTNTIYPPQLEFRWNDYSFNTGSSTKSILDTPESFISVYNNVGTYYSGSISRFRIAAVPKYPIRQFITSSQYSINYYLPPLQSFYSIKDSDTNINIIDFDPIYTKISADDISSYFDVYMDGFEPERYYTILIKTIIDGSTKIFDEKIMFKVSNK